MGSPSLFWGFWGFTLVDEPREREDEEEPSVGFVCEKIFSYGGGVMTAHVVVVTGFSATVRAPRR